MIGSVVAAIGAAVCFATAVVFQQEAAVQAKADGPGRGGIAGLALTVVRRRVWLSATLVDFGGFLLQAVALHLGQITVVQPILVLVLGFGMLLGAWRSHLRLGGRDLVGVAALCLGLAGFVLASSPTHPVDEVGRLPTRLPLLVVGVLAFAGLGILASRRLPPTARALMLAVIAGTCFAGVAAIVKRVGVEVAGAHGVVSTLTDWPVYALAVVALSGLAIEQSAFAAGPLVPTLVTLTLVDPIASLVTGVLVYGETLRGGAGPVAAAVLFAAVTVVGVVLVSRSRATALVQAPAEILARAG